MDYYCSVCRGAITEEIGRFSVSRFGKPLCLEHQKVVKPTSRYYCSECRKTIFYGEYKYSLRNFDKPLCRDCQPEIEEKMSVAPQKRELNRTSRIEFGRSSAEKKLSPDNY